MNQRVQEFINQQKIQDEYNKNMEKAKVLTDLGLYDKEYSENPAWSEKYPEYEYDQVTQQGKYFRKIPISVTDEEYAEILKYASQNNISSINENDNKNKIASMFTGIAYAIFIVGAIFGFVMGYTKDILDDTYSFSFAIAIAWWCVSFIGGMFMLGFAEIIKLLNAIKNK